MDNILGGHIFWQYWTAGRLEFIEDCGDYYIFAVYNKSRTIPPALEIFLTKHLRGNYVGMGKEKVVIPQRHLAALLFRLPKSEEVEIAKHPFMLQDDAS